MLKCMNKLRVSRRMKKEMGKEVLRYRTSKKKGSSVSVGCKVIDEGRDRTTDPKDL